MLSAELCTQPQPGPPIPPPANTEPHIPTQGTAGRRSPARGHPALPAPKAIKTEAHSAAQLSSHHITAARQGGSAAHQRQWPQAFCPPPQGSQPARREVGIDGTCALPCRDAVGKQRRGKRPLRVIRLLQTGCVLRRAARPWAAGWAPSRRDGTVLQDTAVGRKGDWHGDTTQCLATSFKSPLNSVFLPFPAAQPPPALPGRAAR